MPNALLTGVTGLRAHQQMLDVAGNNLANSNTTGFKSQRTRFADLMYQAVGDNLNPAQIGFGVRTSGADTNFQQGSLEATGNDLDLAITGAGFFVVKGPREYYTRAGAFGIGKDNYLVDLGTGYQVQRTGTVGEGSATAPAFQVTGDNGIKIPVGTALPGQQTSVVTLQGNLSASATGPLAEALTTTQPFLSAGVPATLTTLLNALQDNVTPYAAGDQIQIQGTDANGAVINTTVAVNGTTTLGDLVNAVSAAYPQATASLDAAGNLRLTADSTGPASLTLQLADEPGNTGQSNFAAHGLTETTAGKNGDTVTTGIQVFDSQGTARNLTLVFTKQPTNTWDLSASIPAADGVMVDGSVQGITFADNGSFLGITGTGAGDADISFQITGLGSPQTVSFSFGAPGGFNGLTQFGGASTAAAVQQDGFTSGTLARLDLGTDGTIHGVFSNGRILPIAQLGIANFNNPYGLSREGNNLFAATSSSGIAVIGPAETANRGSIRQGNLEGSNVDVALEFTRLIIAQRGFSVNAKAVTIASEVLQELSNIIR